MTGRNYHFGEQLAYSDKWDNNIDAYLQWLYETFILLKLLLSSNGSLYVHLDWRVTHYAKVILDEVFDSTLLVWMAMASKMRLSGIINQEDAHKNAMHVNTILFSSTLTQPTIAFMGNASGNDVVQKNAIT